MWGNRELCGQGQQMTEKVGGLRLRAIFHSKTGGYNLNQDALLQLPRRQQTTIFCLRAGHCRLNSHLKRIAVKTSVQCPCGEADQTPEHHLQSHSLYYQARQKIWPTCVSLKTKLWGSAEDLFLTSKYAALTGEEDLVKSTITSNVEEQEGELRLRATSCSERVE